MNRWNPFSKTYTVKCPDGSTKTVYKDIDKALPFHIQGWEGNISSKIKSEHIGNIEIGAEYQSKIEQLLIGIDDINNNVMIDYRLAYLAFQSDPCENNTFLITEIQKISEEQRRLKSFKILISSFIEMAKVNGENNSDRIVEVYCDIMRQMGLSNTCSQEEVMTELLESVENAKLLMRGNS